MFPNNFFTNKAKDFDPTKQTIATSDLKRKSDSLKNDESIRKIKSLFSN